MPEPTFDAILAGSANAFRHGGKKLAKLTHLPVYCVGRATADAARDAGFGVAAIGQGGLQVLLDKIEPGTRLLRLAGEERVTLEIAQGVQIEERVVYRTCPQELSRGHLPVNGVIALHSGAAARHFADEVARLGVDRSEIVLLALGPRIAECAGEGWGAIHIGAAPDDSALLAMAQALCQ